MFAQADVFSGKSVSKKCRTIQILFRRPLEQHLGFVNRKKGFHTSCLPKNGRIKVVFCIKRHKNFELQVQNLKSQNVGTVYRWMTKQVTLQVPLRGRSNLAGRPSIYNNNKPVIYVRKSRETLLLKKESPV